MPVSWISKEHVQSTSLYQYWLFLGPQNEASVSMCDSRAVLCCAELVRQVIAAGEGEGLQVLAENALEGGIYNADALNRMLKNSKHFQRCARRSCLFLVSCDLPFSDSPCKQGVRARHCPHTPPTCFFLRLPDAAQACAYSYPCTAKKECVVQLLIRM